MTFCSESVGDGARHKAVTQTKLNGELNHHQLGRVKELLVTRLLSQCLKNVRIALLVFRGAGRDLRPHERQRKKTTTLGPTN